MKQLLLSLSLIFIFITAKAQSDQQLLASMARIPTADEKSEPKPNRLYKFVNSNLAHTSNKKLYISCNDDSMYYTRDTIKIYQLKNNNYESLGCCKFIKWNMVSDANFLWSDLSTCNEHIDRSYFLHTTRIQPFNKNGNLYLKITRNGILLDIFKVSGLEEAPARYVDENNKVLILIREDVEKLRG